MNAIAQMANVLGGPEEEVPTGPYVIVSGSSVRYAGTNWSKAWRAFGVLARTKPPYEIVLKANGVVARSYKPKRGTV